MLIMLVLPHKNWPYLLPLPFHKLILLLVKEGDDDKGAQRRILIL